MESNNISNQQPAMPEQKSQKKIWLIVVLVAVLLAAFYFVSKKSPETSTAGSVQTAKGDEEVEVKMEGSLFKK